MERRPSVVEEIHQEIKIKKKKKSIPEDKPEEAAQVVTLKKKRKSVPEIKPEEGLQKVSLILPDVSEEKTCDVQLEETPRKASIQSVLLETLLVTEEGLPKLGDEQVDSEIESSFKLKPTKKKSISEEAVVLERPESIVREEDPEIDQKVC